MHYPKGAENILKSYEGQFESCFILFHPFLKMKGDDGGKSRISSSQENEIPNVIKDIFKEITLPSNATIYSSNPNYPEEVEIIENGMPVEWKEVLNNSDGLNSYEDIQKGLKTSIGAYRRIFQRNDLMNSVMEVLAENNYWSPREDDINTLTKLLLFKIFNLLDVKSAVNLDYSSDSNPIEIEKLDEQSFCKAFNSTLIYSENKEVMILQDRDTFFCLMLTKHKETMQKIITAFNPEGILCDNETCLPWEFGNDEYLELLDREKIEIANRKKAKEKKSKGWLRRIFGK